MRAPSEKDLLVSGMLLGDREPPNRVLLFGNNSMWSNQTQGN